MSPGATDRFGLQRLAQFGHLRGLACGRLGASQFFILTSPGSAACLTSNWSTAHLRHKVRPGITGWAQVNGMRGETDTPDKMLNRIRFDLEYVDGWSLWLDLKIMGVTARQVLRDPNAY